MAPTIIVISQGDVSALPGAPWGNSSATVATVASRVTQLVVEKWATPRDPVPPSVKEIALAAATRALQNTAGYSSTTLSTDETTRTVRWGENDRATRARTGVYLTDTEMAYLRSEGQPRSKRRVRSVRTIPGY